MPLYEYECDTCGHRFEVIQKFSDATGHRVPEVPGRGAQAVLVAGDPVQGLGLLHHRLRQEERHAGRVAQGRGLGENRARSRRRAAARAKSRRRPTAAPSRSSSSGDAAQDRQQHQAAPRPRRSAPRRGGSAGRARLSPARRRLLEERRAGTRPRSSRRSPRFIAKYIVAFEEPEHRAGVVPRRPATSQA